MNRDEILRMAREAMFTQNQRASVYNIERLERFTAIVADAVRVSCTKSSEIAASRNARLIKREAIEAEREACAKVCEIVGQRDTSFEAEDCALEIRARTTSLTS